MSGRLARSNQARQQMTADIAHDLRTPLSVIEGYTESLRDGVLQPSTETFEIMHGEVELLHRLVDDLRTLSLADAGALKLHIEPVNPNELMEHAAAAFSPEATRRGINLRVVNAGSLPELPMDPDRMAQVIANLVSNALRHTSEGGEVTLSASMRAQSLALEVRDNGSGIAPDELPLIFNRFYRSDPSRQQTGETGLGLAIARSLVELHHGSISVQSEPGRGAAFTVLLPV
jgi:signal transduction histidine kinase